MPLNRCTESQAKSLCASEPGIETFSFFLSAFFCRGRVAAAAAGEFLYVATTTMSYDRRRSRVVISIIVCVWYELAKPGRVVVVTTVTSSTFSHYQSEGEKCSSVLAN